MSYTTASQQPTTLKTIADLEIYPSHYQHVPPSLNTPCVKTLEREFKRCLTALTSRALICRLPDLFQFYLNQCITKHVLHVLFQFQL